MIRPEETEGILKAIVDNLPVALFAKEVSNDYRFILWNKKQEEITTISRENALGKSDYELFSTESAKYFRQIDELIVKRGAPLKIPEEIIETDKGGTIHLRTEKFPITRGGRTVVVGISEDITERVTAREQLEHLSKNLSEKDKELERTHMQLIQAEKLESIGRLAAGVAHEVKNPLALLLMSVEYLKSGIDPNDENIEIILGEMTEAINRADSIVKGLVDFSSDRQISKEPVDPADLCDHALLLIRHELTKHSVQVNRFYQRPLDNIHVDWAKFEQVLINLFINAIHAMNDSPTPTLEVTIRAGELDEVKRDEGMRTLHHFRSGDRIVLIRIKDNGEGISHENISKVFDPFFTTKATGVGTGLGLSVVRKIIELHNGEISISNSANNEGAIVEIHLPVNSGGESDRPPITH